MKILIITDKMELGGAETHIHALCHRLIERGHEVSVMSAGGIYLKSLSAAGAEIISAPLDKRDFRSIIKSRKILKRVIRGYDIIHAHTRFTSTLAKKVRGRSGVPKIVTTAHLPFEKRGLGRFTSWGDITLAVSRDIKEHLIECYGVRAENIVLTKNGINLAHFKPSHDASEYIVHTSRIDTGRSKTAFMLAEIAPALFSAKVASGIIIAGSGDRASELRELCEEQNRKIGAAYLKFIGAVADARCVLRKGKIFVGVSRALLEAMAMGIPSVACGDEGYGGIITDDSIERLEATNFCARGLSSADNELLLRDIMRLATDSELREKSSRDALALTKREYSDEVLAEDAIKAYGMALEQRRVTLLGYFGFENLGDEQIMRIATDELLSRQICRVNILVKNPGAKEESDGLRYYNRSSLGGIFSALCICDILILPGGNLLQNETSLRSLIYYSAAIRLARIMKKRVYMLSSGIGRLSGVLARSLAALSLGACDFIGARTSEDKRLISAISPKRESVIMPDMCFLLNVPSTHPHNRKKLCFAVVASCGNTPSPADIKALEKYTRLSAKIIVISKLADTECVRRAYARADFPIYLPDSFEELSELFADCLFSISARLHGAIFSLVCSVPTLLRSHSLKNRALISEVEKRCSQYGKASPIISYAENDSFTLLGDIIQHGTELIETLPHIFRAADSPEGEDIAVPKELLAGLRQDCTDRLDMLFGKRRRE